MSKQRRTRQMVWITFVISSLWVFIIAYAFWYIGGFAVIVG